MNGPRKRKIKLPPLSKLRKSFQIEMPEDTAEVRLSQDEPKIHLRGYYSDLLGPNTFPASDLFNGAENYESSLWNAFTDQHMPNVRSFNASHELISKRVTGVLNKTMKAALPDTDFAESSYEPKVQLPYVVPSRMCPREVEILRRKKQFASLDLEALLKDLNIDSNLLMPKYDDIDEAAERPKVILNADPEDPAPFPCYLDLDLFDNTEYDCRNPSEWIELGRVNDNVYKPVPGIALLPVWDDVRETDDDISNIEYKWMDVGMLSYNYQTRRYLVQKVDCNGRVLDHLGRPTILGPDLMKRTNKENIMGNQYWVPRIRLMFRAEDPRIFANRVAEAYFSRKRTENLLRYEFYVDCMPFEGVGELDPVSLKKMTETAKKALPPAKDKESFEEYVNVLEKEIKIDYCRTMNKIIFHKVVYENSKMFAFVTLPECEQPKYKINGCISDMPPYDFKEYLRSFVFKTLLIRPEVSHAITKVRAECQKVASMSLFTTTTNKPVKIEEFEQIQSQTTAQVSLYMKDSWIASLRVAIRTAFRDIGKGWFNLYEKNWGVYQISKMKRFMEMVKFYMQDALRYLVQDSLSGFTQMIIDACNSTLDLDESYKWDENMLISPFKPKRNPLINVEIGIDNGAVVYSYPLPNVAPLFVTMFDRAIMAVQNIPQLEKLVMEEISFPDVTFLEAVGMHEPPIVELRKILIQTINKAIIPMNAYALLYEQFVPIIQIDQSTLPKELETKGLTPRELKEKIEMYEEMQENIKLQLPSSIIIGLFNVSTDNLKQKIIKKCKIISVTVLDLLAKLLRKHADDASEEYKNISRKLFERSNCIEEVVEKREWIKTIPSRMEEYMGLATQAMEDYNLIEGFNYNLSNEDFNIKWNTVGWPRKINIQIENALQTLLEEEEKYRKLQVTDQSHFSDKIDLLSMHVANIPGLTDIGKAHEYANHCRRLFKELKEAQAEAVKYNTREKLFGMAITSYDKLHELIKDFEPYRQLWVTVSDWLRWHDSWMNDPLLYVDADMVEKNVTESYRIMHKCYKMFFDVPGIGHVAETVRDMIENFKPHIALIQSLRNPGMKQRHWDMLALEIGFLVNLKSELTFAKCLDMKLQDHVEVIQKIADIAGKEYSIEKIIEKMSNEWENVNFEVMPYKNTGTHIIKVGEEIGQMMDDHIVLTQGLSFNPYKKPFEEQIKQWESTLTTAQEVLDMWLTVQKQWLYLEPIFSSEDIIKQLPVESKRFQTVDRSWRKILKNTIETPKVITLCKDINLLMSLTECHGLLEQVEKGLSEYLETKRIVFPRFYFLSDDELLEILSQTTDPSAVQPHLKKCFENIAKVTFSESQEITEMISSEGEVVSLCRSFKPEGNVEEWMLMLESVMQESLKILLRKALDDYIKTPRKEWVLSWPGQLVIAGSQTYWSAEVTEAIADDLLLNYNVQLLEQLDDLRNLVSGSLTKMSRLILSALIVIDVHARDVVANMVKQKVKDINDFEWISQLRYYWMRDSFYIQAVNAEFLYGFEYLGNSGRLVITPLTDRCYLTLTGALHLKFGGAPAGPAGTGKTETTKDLAKAMAIQCVVFNCSDQLDFLAMGKFLKGLASSGAWACFDEFNRIDVEVLSVVAQQITTIQNAQQQKVDSFVFEGVEINLKSSCAIFITMNPGYAGRTELPDNLKALFRPVAMMVPDYALIAEISLFSYGFSNARNLAKKIVMTFKLSSEQLSSQDHYDFGMRAVKSVISAAGNIKRQNPYLNEDLMTLRAIRDVNVPKFLMDDLILFSGIVSDLFPNITEEPIDYGSLMTALKDTCAKKSLEAVDGFINKCIQLYETTVVRHGLMLVGPTGSGKTKCYEVLQEAQTSLKGVVSPSGALFETTYTYITNPKSITMGQLYGEFDLQTHEWTDGIISTLMRIGAAATDSDKRWYMFDGPVDAMWIESMNSVLDDNKKLCLTSGEIIKITDNMTLMFEVEDLAVASPATVSRCGMVYLEPSILGLDPFINCWLKEMCPNLQPFQKRLKELIEIFLEPGIRTVRTKCIEMIPSVDFTLVHGFFKLLDCFFRPFVPKKKQPIQMMNFEPVSNARLLNQPEIIDYWFCFAVVWGLGSTCNAEGRPKFNHWMRKTMKKNKIESAFPAEGLVYDYYLDDGGISLPHDDEDKELELLTIVWKQWMEDEPDFHLSTNVSFADIMVPTMDTVRSTYMLDLLLVNNIPVMCVGPTGTGKTLTISDKLSRNMPNYFLSEFICFSAKTTSYQTQSMIDGKLDKRRKGVYGPPVGKHMVIFIDDFNMPALDMYGSQPSIELIRQYMDFKGWYDLKAIGEFRKMLDLCFVCGMGLPGGGRNPITPRLMRHFMYIIFTELEISSMITIFTAILNSRLETNLDISSYGNELVKSSITVYNTVITQLLPTPTKCHYSFNLRDLSKVFQGMMMADILSIKNLPQLLRLWYHENERVFGDRLINEDDRQAFAWFCASEMKRAFNLEFTDVVKKEILLYCHQTSPNNMVDKVYSEVTSTSQLLRTFLEAMEDYNQVNVKKLNLVLFSDAIRHMCRILRIIRQPLGNALLLGVGGSGRQSLTKLASHMSEFELIQIELSKNYGIAEWKEDLKKVMLKAGLEFNPIVFFFSDTQIKHESFLEDLCNILNSGSVPNIYTDDELENIYTQTKVAVLEANLIPTKTIMYSFFTKKVRSNLHTVIAMSPMGEVFRSRLRQFPGLVNNCTIDWFSEWPEDALESVAKKSLENMDGLQDDSPAIIDGLVKMCKEIHLSVEESSKLFKMHLSRNNYVTPTTYLELLVLFKKMLSNKKTALTTAYSRTKTGLDKLLTTAEEVAVLQGDLEVMQPLLDEATKEAEETVTKIKEDTKIAEETRVAVLIEETNADMKAKDTQAIADDAQKDLNEALPALDAALASLKTLNKNDIVEVRALQRPPDGVKMVIDAVCIMKNAKPKKILDEKGGKKDDYWDVGKSLLVEPQKFLESLFKFDKDNISDATIKSIQPYIENEAFQPSAIAKVSKACTSICQWVRAMYKYHFVAKAVAPKREALKHAQEELTITRENLAQTKFKLKAIKDGLEVLQERYDECVQKKEELDAKAKECQAKLSRADKLISGLADEKNRWIESIDSIEITLKNIVGDIIIAAANCAYLGAFTEEYRSNLVDKWSKHLKQFEIPFNENANLVETLGDPMLIRNWQIAGLPKDNLSIENGVIVQHSRRWPLFIDPQGQANRWIKNMEKDNLIEVVKMTDKDFLRNLENSIRFGKPCLIENIREEIDPTLEPILLQETFKHEGSLVIRLGDAVIPYHNDFKLYITTKMPNPHYSPEASSKVTLVNFTLSESGLEGQLLGLVVAEERPDLEDAKNQLLVNNAKMKMELKEIEDKILLKLSSSEGNPVDDLDLIQTLDASKVKSGDIKAKVVAAEQTERDIDETRGQYSPVATNTQILYFSVSNLNHIDPMYQYSLEWFISIFINSIRNARSFDMISKRCSSINEHFTFNLYCNVCRSLFEKHKLLFAFLLSIRILQNKGSIHREDYRFLLTGVTQKGKEAQNPCPEWLTSRSWMEILNLASLKAFKLLLQDFIATPQAFKAIFDDAEPHRHPFPSPWEENLSDFQKILLIRCLRPDKLTNAMQDFISKNLGEQFVEPQTVNLGTIFKDSSPGCPLIFILSQGTDPAADLYKFADEMKFSKKLISISLGQGQGPRAESILQQGMDRGFWVFFQNCHLSPSWMPSLEKLIAGIEFDKVHKDFRLWLTSMPSAIFPVFILQNGAKMTMEPPRGIKANLLKAYSNFSDDFLKKIDEDKLKTFKLLLFSLCLFHGAILERRKFGSLGFNISYEFTDGDLRICVSQLKMFLSEYKTIPFKVLAYTAGEINYGGRVTDDWDRRCMSNILADYYNGLVLEVGHKFYARDEYVQISPDSDQSAYLQYIRSLPLNDTSDIFGLHANANITFAQNEAYTLLNALLLLQPKTSSAGTMTREQVVEDMAMAIEDSIPEEINLEYVVKAYPVMYEQSMNTVLAQEIMRYNRLLRVINSSLNDLFKALRGQVIMSEDLELMSDSIFNNQVPAKWTAKAYPSLKPLSSWVSDLTDRIGFILNWIEKGIPPVFWISGFFFPQAFLTGTLQNYARQKVVPIDTIAFDFQMVKIPLEDLVNPPDLGCYIHGLYLEGARWDMKKFRLEESFPKELYTTMPCIWLKPTEDRKFHFSGIYVCPVYKTLKRAGVLSTTGHSTNFVFAIEIPTNKHQSHWIKRSVALLCALDY